MPDDTLIFPNTLLGPAMKKKQLHVTDIKSLCKTWASSTTVSFARSAENHSTLFPKPAATAPKPQTPQILSFAQFQTLRAQPKTLMVDTRTPRVHDGPRPLLHLHRALEVPRRRYVPHLSQAYLPPLVKNPPSLRYGKHGPPQRNPKPY
jgi:hypothetical protein